MSSTTQTTVTNLGVATFTVADQDAAKRFSTEVLGWEERADVRFGPDGAFRWVEVAPPGSTARLALNPPMQGEPGGGSIGVETPDARGERERLEAAGVAVDPMMEGGEGAPTMFALRDPDGNYVWVVETP
jgi:lactoylglutathione lyase